MANELKFGVFKTTASGRASYQVRCFWEGDTAPANLVTTRHSQIAAMNLASRLERFGESELAQVA